MTQPVGKSAAGKRRKASFRAAGVVLLQGAALLAVTGQGAFAQSVSSSISQPTSREDFAARAQQVQRAGAPAGFGTPGIDQFNCTIRPMRVVEVAAEINGVAKTVLVRPGQQVSKGDLLVELYSDMTRADLRLAEAQANSTGDLRAAEIRRDGAARKEARLKDALNRRAISPSDYEGAALELEIARNDVERQQQALDLAQLEAEQSALLVAKSEVRAPVTGIVGEDLIDPGESTAGRAVATLYDNHPLRVEAYVPAGVMADFVAGGHFAIAVNDSAEAPLPVALDYVAQLADLTSGTISVFFTLEAPDVLPGSKCLISTTKTDETSGGTK